MPRSVGIQGWHIWLLVASATCTHAVYADFSVSHETTVNRGPRISSTRSLEDDIDIQKELRKKFYQRYDWYPEECSLPDHIVARAVPPLDSKQTNVRGKNTRLVHVTGIVRHGTRTIAEAPTNDADLNNHQCWEGYWDNNETAIWDCPLSTFMMPPNPQRIFEEEGVNDPFEEAFIPQSMFLYRKIYDALKSPQSNELGGTCQKGQLLLRGYDQMVSSGKLLRDAYMADFEASHKTSALDLFPVGAQSEDTSIREPWSDESKLYLRSDDHPATLLSGQLLMRGLFEKELMASRERLKKQQEEQQQQQNQQPTSDGEFDNQNAFPIIPVHTADMSKDYMAGLDHNPTYPCKAFQELQQASDESWEYRSYQQTEDAIKAKEALAAHFLNQSEAMDCILSTICSDRPFPGWNNFLSSHGHSSFRRIQKYFPANHSFHLNYNDGEYAKLSTAPLWAEIMDHILPVVKASDVPSEGQDDTGVAPAKLAIYSGYDSTIVQLLASLGAWKDLKWPPYASMILLEIHELGGDRNESFYPSRFGFRLLYNGAVLTKRIPGCIGKFEICDITKLLDRVEAFAKREIDCTEITYETISPKELLQDLFTTTGGIVLALLIVAASALVGSIGVFYHLTGVVPTKELPAGIIPRQD